MYKEKVEDVEVYFICYKKEEMELVETYYDEVLDTHCWYFNAYLSYKYWKKKFANLVIDDIAKMFLTVGASRYILYKIENGEYKNDKERRRLVKDLKLIEPKLQRIVEDNRILLSL